MIYTVIYLENIRHPEFCNNEIWDVSCFCWNTQDRVNELLVKTKIKPLLYFLVY